MKIKLTLLILISLGSILSHAQNYNSKNIAEEKAKLDAEIKKAVSEDDFVKAQQLKDVKTNFDKIDQIDQQIKSALVVEDYEKADKLQQDRNKLIAQLSGGTSGSTAATTTTSGQQKTTTTTTSNSNAELFNSLNAINKATTEMKAKNNSTAEDRFFAGKGSVLGAGLAITNARFKDPDQSERYDAGLSFLLDFKHYRNIKSFNENAGIRFYAGMGFIPYAFKKKIYDAKWYFTYLSFGTGFKANYKGFFTHLGWFVDVGLTATQTVGENKQKPYEADAMKRSNTGFVYRLGYEIRKLEFYFEHRLGAKNIEKHDQVIDQKTTLSAIIFGLGLKLGNH